MPGFLFRSKWLAFHTVVIVAVVVMVNLGFWQLRRLDERREFNADVTERTELPPVALEDLLADPDFDPDASEYRLVRAQGTFLPDQIVLFNRSQAGRAVDNVLTALALTDGTTVLVNRGAIPVQAEPPPPPSAVDLVGRLRTSEGRSRGDLTDAEQDVVSQTRRVDLDLLSDQLPGTPAPVYIDLVASEPAVTESDPIPLGPPDLSERNHLSYAFQWFIFAGCVVIGWVLAVRRSIATRRRSADRTPEAPGPDRSESPETVIA